MPRWMNARKKPITIEFRDVIGEREVIETREGVLIAIRGKHFIIRGVDGIIPNRESDILSNL